MIDATIVMDIDMARELLHLGPDAVSTFNVEPADGVNADELIARIEHGHPRRAGAADLAIQPDRRLGDGTTQPVPPDGGRPGLAGRRRGDREYDVDEHIRTLRRVRRDAPTVGHVATSWPSSPPRARCLGLLSGVLGGGLATVGVLTLNRFLQGFALDLSPWLLVASLAGALLIASLSGLYPAWKASRMTPMDAIRHSAA